MARSVEYAGNPERARPPAKDGKTQLSGPSQGTIFPEGGHGLMNRRFGFRKEAQAGRPVSDGEGGVGGILSAKPDPDRYARPYLLRGLALLGIRPGEKERASSRERNVAGG